MESFTFTIILPLETKVGGVCLSKMTWMPSATPSVSNGIHQYFNKILLYWCNWLKKRVAKAVRDCWIGKSSSSILITSWPCRQYTKWKSMFHFQQVTTNDLKWNVGSLRCWPGPRQSFAAHPQSKIGHPKQKLEIEPSFANPLNLQRRTSTSSIEFFFPANTSLMPKK